MRDLVRCMILSGELRDLARCMIWSGEVHDHKWRST